MDLSGFKVVESHGEKRHTLIVRSDFLWYKWVYFMRPKSDDAEMFEHFLAYTRADRVSFNRW